MLTDYSWNIRTLSIHKGEGADISENIIEFYFLFLETRGPSLFLSLLFSFAGAKMHMYKPPNLKSSLNLIQFFDA